MLPITTIINDNDMEQDEAGPSTPRQPRYPPLLSASLFPPPPSSHIHFTPENIELYFLLKDRLPSVEDVQAQEELSQAINEQNDTVGPDGSRRLVMQTHLLLEHAPARLHPQVRALAKTGLDLRLVFDPPDLAIIEKELKGYSCYGEWWPIPRIETGLEEAGVRKLYDEADIRDSQGRLDPRETLLLLLRSLLTTYLKLLALLQFPPSYDLVKTLLADTNNFSTSEPLPQDATAGSNNAGEEQWLSSTSHQWSHLRLLTLNIQELLNRSRARQAQANLEGLLQQQVQRRWQEAKKMQEATQKARELVARLREG